MLLKQSYRVGRTANHQNNKTNTDKSDMENYNLVQEKEPVTVLLLVLLPKL